MSPLKRRKKTWPKNSYVLHPIKGEQPIAFIPHPEERGRWLKVHPCVITDPCSICGAKRGEPCTFSRGYGSGTHWNRNRFRWKDLLETYSGLAISIGSINVQVDRSVSVTRTPPEGPGGPMTVLFYAQDPEECGIYENVLESTHDIVVTDDPEEAVTALCYSHLNFDHVLVKNYDGYSRIAAAAAEEGVPCTWPVEAPEDILMFLDRVRRVN